GIVFEALHIAGGLKMNLLVILNDNKMSICPRVGALASCLDQARLTSFYQGSKRQIHNLVSHVPFVGIVASHALHQVRDGLKAMFTGGMLFEELGFRYIGPIDGYDLPSLRCWLRDVQDQQGHVHDHSIYKSHADTSATRPAKARITPNVAIYSTFFQRTFHQITQEVALQILPVTFDLDPSVLTRPDLPTHHRVFDTAYLRLFP